jgi:hypothetical protein
MYGSQPQVGGRGQLAALEGSSATVNCSGRLRKERVLGEARVGIVPTGKSHPLDLQHLRNGRSGRNGANGGLVCGIVRICLTFLRTNRSVVTTPMWSFERIHSAEPEAIGI